MTFVDDIRTSLDAIRAIPTEIGVRPYEVTVRKVVWSGARIGLGSPTTTDTRVSVGNGDPAVRLVSSSDVLASGGLYQSQDLRVGPMTAGVVTQATVDPIVAASTEVTWILTRDGTSATYRAVERDTVSATKHFVVLRKVGT